MAQSFESALKCLAYLGAGGFFLWKLFTGWLIINLGLTIHMERVCHDDAHDLLAATLVLTKGPTDTLWIKDVSLRVTPGNPPPQAFAPTDESVELFADGVIFHPREIRQLEVEGGRINWTQVADKKAKLTLSPHEQTQFARIALVPRDKPVFVEAAVHGDRTFWSRGFQWRASAVSLTACERKQAQSLAGQEQE